MLAICPNSPEIHIYGGFLESGGPKLIHVLREVIKLLCSQYIKMDRCPPNPTIFLARHARLFNRLVAGSQ